MLRSIPFAFALFLSVMLNPFELRAQSCLVGQYSFDNSFSNSAGGGLNANYSGAIFGKDRCGRADSSLQCTEMDSVAIVNDAAALDFSNAMTVTAWINFGYAANSNPRIVSKWGGPFTASSYELYTPQLLHGRRTVVFSTSDGSSEKNVQSVSSLEPLAWHFVAGTFLNGTLRVYIDGVLDNTANYSPFSINNSSSDMTFGQKNGSSGVDYFFGKIDDVMLFNCALSATQIDSIYASQLTACTIYDSVTVNDTNIVEVFDSITVVDTMFVTIYDTLGVYTDTVTYTDSVTVTDTLVIDVDLIGAPTPGMMNTIKVYPNPVSDHLIIHNGEHELMTGYTVTIRNTLGQQVFQGPLDQPLYYLDLNFWKGNGAYILSITDENDVVVDQRVIVLQ